MTIHNEFALKKMSFAGIILLCYYKNEYHKNGVISKLLRRTGKPKCPNNSLLRPLINYDFVEHECINSLYHVESPVYNSFIKKREEPAYPIEFSGLTEDIIENCLKCGEYKRTLEKIFKEFRRYAYY